MDSLLLSSTRLGLDWGPGKVWLWDLDWRDGRNDSPMVVTAESNKTDRMLLSALLSVKTMNPQGGAYYILPQNIIILQLFTWYSESVWGDSSISRIISTNKCQLTFVLCVFCCSLKQTQMSDSQDILVDFCLQNQLKEIKTISQSTIYLVIFCRH